MVFDPDWCVAVCGESHDEDDDDVWAVDLDQSGTRAHVVRYGFDTLTLRGARPLPRPPHATTASSFRVIIEDYGDNEYCTIGFVPGDAQPVFGHEIYEYGGWCICVAPFNSRPLFESCAFASLAPLDGAEKRIIPPVPRGSAVEFTVIYSGSEDNEWRCRVAFYEAANARDFAASPYKVLELRFAETEEYGSNPARPRLTATTGMTLYPAVGLRWSGGIVSFASMPETQREVKVPPWCFFLFFLVWTGLAWCRLSRRY
jgi:hypothetical protein